MDKGGSRGEYSSYHVPCGESPQFPANLYEGGEELCFLMVGVIFLPHHEGLSLTRKHMFSMTYSGVIVMVIGSVFTLAGVPFVEGNVEITIATLTDFVGAC